MRGFALVPKLLGGSSSAHCRFSGINLNQLRKAAKDWVGGALRQPMTSRRLREWKLEVRALGFLDDGEGAGAPADFFIPKYPEVQQRMSSMWASPLTKSGRSRP